MKLRFCTPLIIAASALTPQLAVSADLSEIYQMAASKDSVIQASRAQYEAAIAALPLARSAILPQITVSADIAKNEINDDTSGAFGDGSLGASITQFVYNPTAWRSVKKAKVCLLYTSPSPRDKRQSRMPSSA